MKFTIVNDIADLNQALFQVTHGLYILTAKHEGRLNGQCLDALMQVTSAPPRIAIGINKRSLTHEMIAATGRFVANVLDRSGGVVAGEELTTPPKDEDWMEVIRHFGFQSGRTVDKFAKTPHELSENGIPILPEAKAFYECHVVPEMTQDLGTHTLFVALVERAGTRDDGEPLTYNEYRKSMRKRR